MYNDPPFLYSFALMHISVLLIVTLFMFPRWFNFLIPEARRDDGKYEIMPQQPLGDALMRSHTVDLERINAQETLDVTTDDRASLSEPKIHPSISG